MVSFSIPVRSFFLASFNDYWFTSNIFVKVAHVALVAQVFWPAESIPVIQEFLEVNMRGILEPNMRGSDMYLEYCATRSF